MNFTSHSSPQFLGKLNILVSYSKYRGCALEETKAGSLVVRHHCSPSSKLPPPPTHTHTHTQSGLSYQKLMKRQPLFNLPSPKCTFRFFTLTNILCHTPCLKMFANSTLPPVSLQKSKWWGVGGGSLKPKKRFPLSTLSISR